MIIAWKKNFVDAVKFIGFFFLTFVLGQLIKNPLESAFVNGPIASKLSYKITFFYISIPSIVFYVLVGAALSMLMKGRIIFWFFLFCILELSWIFSSTSIDFYEPNIYSHLLIYFRYIIIPLAVISGILIHKKLREKKGSIIES